MLESCVCCCPLRTRVDKVMLTTGGTGGELEYWTQHALCIAAIYRHSGTLVDLH